jgi:hypothetical protein
MDEKQIELSDEVREQLAHKLAPVVKHVADAAGTYTTLLNAHACLADPANRLQLSVPRLGPLGAAAAGVVIIITS